MPQAPSQPPDFDPVATAKHLLRTIRAGALATLDAQGAFPFASLVTVATDLDGSPLLLISRLAAHTRNLEADPRASILLSQGGKGDPLAHPRLTVIGTLARTDEPRVRMRFLARHPKAALYAEFADFSFWRMELDRVHLNGGFARAAELGAAEVRTDVSDAEALVAAAESAVEHMNADHREALALYATRLAGERAADWRATGVDPEGIDLAAGDRTARIAFPHRVDGPGPLRAVLKALADEARGRG